MQHPHIKISAFFLGLLFFSPALFSQNLGTAPVSQTTIFAEKTSIVGLPGKISIYGMEAATVHVSVYNEQWLLVSGQWVTTQNLHVPDLLTGNYFVRIEFMNAERNAVLAKKEAYVFVPDPEISPNYDKVSVASGPARIEIGGLPAQQTRVSVYNEQWLLIDRHFVAEPEAVVTDLADGNYFVRIEFFDAARASMLGKKETYVSVGNAGAAPSSGESSVNE